MKSSRFNRNLRRSYRSRKSVKRLKGGRRKTSRKSFKGSLKKVKSVKSVKRLKGGRRKTKKFYKLKNIIGGSSNSTCLEWNQTCFPDKWIDGKSINITKKIGSGSFGIVWKAIYTSGTQPDKEVVVKQLNKDRPDNSVENEKQQFIQEALILNEISSHVNIVQCLGMSIIDQEPSIIFEKCGYDLKTFLIKNEFNNKNPQNFLKIRYATEIANGMEHLHSKKILHLDLSARNILICGTSSLDNRCKITDFGLSGKMKAEEVYEHTFKKFPPALFKIYPHDFSQSSGFTIKNDIWSFGLLMFQLIFDGIEPYANLNNAEFIELRASTNGQILNYNALINRYNKTNAIACHEGTGKSPDLPKFNWEYYYSTEDNKNTFDCVMFKCMSLTDSGLKSFTAIKTALEQVTKISVFIKNFMTSDTYRGPYTDDVSYVE